MLSGEKTSEPVATSSPSPAATAADPPDDIPPTPALMEYFIAAPIGASFDIRTAALSPAISPDGSHVVFVAYTPGGPPQLWLHSFKGRVDRALIGTESPPAVPGSPFWSPDNRQIAFAIDKKLKRVDLISGAVTTICDLPGGNIVGGTWAPDGTILFAGQSGGLWRVQPGSSSPVLVTTTDEQKNERYKHPSFLPDGKHFVFQITPGRTLALGSLDDPKITRLGSTDSRVVYASGFLLFVQSKHLMAQAFDLKLLKTKGAAMKVVENVSTHEPSGLSAFTVSSNGVLVYRGGGNVPEDGVADTLAWFHRSDQSVHPIERVAPDFYVSFELLPDDRRVLTQVHRPDGSGNLWLVNLAEGTRQQLTEGISSHDHSPVISAVSNDSFMWFRGDSNAVLSMPWNGESPEKVLHQPKPNIITALTDWSKNWLIETMRDTQGKSDIWYVPVHDPDNAVRYEENPAVERDAKLSPDERWIAYVEEDAEGSRVVVRSFPSTLGKWIIEDSSNAREVRWRADGQELFFTQTAGLGITAVTIKPGDRALEIGSRRRYPIPVANLIPVFNLNRGFAVTRDGQRFLVSLKGIVTNKPSVPSQTLRALANWTQLIPAH
jgi:Tol biopolymer transport system component